MNRKLFYCVASCVLATSQETAAQTYIVGKGMDPLSDEMPSLIPYRKDSLWGYADPSGKVVIQPQYNYAYFFSGKLAGVMLNDRESYGVIDTKGNLLTSDNMQWLDLVTDTTALIVASNTDSNHEITYFIDNHKSKKMYSELKLLSMEEAYPRSFFRNGYGIAYDEKAPDKYYVIDGMGKTITSMSRDAFNAKGYSAGGKLLIPPGGRTFRNGFHYMDGTSSGYRYMSLKGDIFSWRPKTYVTQYNYDPVKYGRMIAIMDDRPGVIDTLGNIVVPFGKYVTLDDYSDGMAKGMRYREGGDLPLDIYIDVNGKELLVTPKYKDLEDFHEGLARVTGNQKKTYDDVCFINKQGKEVFRLKKAYDEIGYFCEGLCRVKVDVFYGFIDTKGKEVIPATLEYDEVSDFSQGYALVKKNGLYGFIDKQGKEFIAPVYTQLAPFSSGTTDAYTGNSDWGYAVLDTKGNKAPYRAEKDVPWVGNYRVVTDAKGAKGVIDRSLKVVVPFGTYDYIVIYECGLASAQSSKWLDYINLNNGVQYFTE